MRYLLLIVVINSVRSSLVLLFIIVMNLKTTAQTSSIQVISRIKETNSPGIQNNIISYRFFTDKRDGRIYKILQIGDQVWMAENLSYKAGSGCWSYNNDQGNVSVYGYLYNWATAKNVCPPGWHLPADSEWNALIDHLGGSWVAGGMLKEAGTRHWITPNEGATNETGFSALPGGLRFGSGTSSYIGTYGYWWTSDEGSPVYAWYRGMCSHGKDIGRYAYYKRSGFSVRCLKN